MTPGTGAEAFPGLTDFEARSGGEGEVGASVIGTYWFAQSVDEMTVHPRPASPEPMTVVETDHPLCSSSNAAPRRDTQASAYLSGPVAALKSRAYAGARPLYQPIEVQKTSNPRNFRERP